MANDYTRMSHEIYSQLGQRPTSTNGFSQHTAGHVQSFDEPANPAYEQVSQRVPSGTMIAFGNGPNGRGNGHSPVQEIALDLPTGSMPMFRFYTEVDPPWVPVRGNAPMGFQRQSNPNVNFTSFRDQQTFSIDEASSHYQGDSAYHSASVKEPTEGGHESLEITPTFDHLQPFTGRGADTQQPYKPSEGAKEVSQPAQKTQGSRKGPLQKCPFCGEVPKCNSEYKKHINRHKKPFKCQWPDCKRQDGFQTQNDLQRHEKSVHGSSTSGSWYQCAGKGCKHLNKRWPRLDNFKQHVQRMHKTENQDKVIKNSKVVLPPPGPSQPENTIRYNMAEDLVGMDPAAAAEGQSTTLGAIMNSHPGQPGLGDHAIMQWGEFESPNMPHQAGTSSQQGVRGSPALSISEEPSPVVDRTKQANELADPLAQSKAPSKGNAFEEPNLKDTRNPAATVSASLGGIPGDLDSISALIMAKLNEGPSDESQAEKLKRALSSLFGGKDSTQNGANGVGGDCDESSSCNSPPAVTLGSLEGSKDLVASSSADMKASLHKDHPAENEKTTPVDAKSRPVNTAQYKCYQKGCNKAYRRQCQLTKHMKRHDRPYGCTYSRCEKYFGSKSDWKRHEYYQHFQLDMWRCDIESCGNQRTHPSANSAPPRKEECGKLYYKRESFINHILEEHNVTASDKVLDRIIANHRIGRNYQGQFWCGFCRSIQRLTKGGVEAWSERIDHIDQHIRDGQSIAGWWCAEYNKTKREVAKMFDRTIFEDEMDDGSGCPQPSANDPGSLIQDSPGASAEGRKRQRWASDDGAMQHRAKKERVWLCCACGSGPHLWSLDKRCNGSGSHMGYCEHMPCQNCTRVSLMDGQMGGEMPGVNPKDLMC
ncbi:hypothetical protein BDY21DRAFT_180942 [Lineolata rhizophorae]|uniref:C2H2-type domain-containing protein n=1 Tax=Lineolata rhizophorae TaxID=578093 RepID=A0A6A6P7D7_9PEZI|nr:hypothetical protein BDY21DRAFT_180942 [Lineolata rhizophorae]